MEEKLKLIETTKGKPCALHNGYRYRIKSVKGDSKTWTCTKDKAEKCRGRLISVGDEEIVKVIAIDHTCKPDTALNEVYVCVFAAKKRAREEDNISTPMSSIYESEVRQLYDRGLEFVTNIPKFQSVKSSLNRHRSKAMGTIKDPVDCQNIVWPSEIFTFEDNSTFLLAEDGNGRDKILIFGTKLGKEAVANGKTFLVDGTFKSCSKQFHQLYTIHVDIGSTHQETNVIPVIYALLPNKKRNTYVRFIELVKTHIPEWDPKLLKVDFEEAAISALKSELPGVNVSGCNFHFNQCLWRKVQSIGLVEEYTNDESIRMHIRMCASLAHLPPGDVEDGWMMIMENSPENSKISLFNDYFVENWMDISATFPIEIWNVYEQRHKTTNCVEGWHNRLNKLTRQKPNLFELIKILKNEALHWDYIYQRHSLNLSGKRRKSKYMQLDTNVQKILQVYNETKDLGKCLKSLSYIHKLQ